MMNISGEYETTSAKCRRYNSKVWRCYLSNLAYGRHFLLAGRRTLVGAEMEREKASMGAGSAWGCMVTGFMKVFGI